MIDTDYILDPMLADDCDPDERGYYHVETIFGCGSAYWNGDEWLSIFDVIIWYDKKPKAII